MENMKLKEKRKNRFDLFEQVPAHNLNFEGDYFNRAHSFKKSQL